MKYTREDKGVYPVNKYQDMLYIGFIFILNLQHCRVITRNWCRVFQGIGCLSFKSHNHSPYWHRRQEKDLTIKMGNLPAKKLDPKTVKDLRKHVNVDFSAEEIQEWYKDFEKHLGPGETALSRTAFIKVYNSLFYGDASAFAEQVFRSFDRDNNNVVDFKEFILGLCMSGSDDPNVKLQWAFRMYDIDQNGYITQDEMNHILQAICKMTNSKIPEEFTSPENMTRKVFKVLDKNSDNKISLQEFVEGAEKVQIIVDILQCDPSPE